MMDKAEAEKVWNGFKPAIEALAAKIAALYEALGSTRNCRTINELWHPERPAIGIGFVPPEAKERLEALIAASGINLYKGNGPHGRGVYFSFLYNAQLTLERIQQLAATVEKETQTVKDSKPKEPAMEVPAEYVGDPQLARLEGLANIRRQELRFRPSEVAGIVEAFNGATLGLTPLQVIRLLATAIPYFEHMPDISRRELLRTIAMMEDAELKA
jgi:hypothetical protein